MIPKIPLNHIQFRKINFAVGVEVFCTLYDVSFYAVKDLFAVYDTVYAAVLALKVGLSGAMSPSKSKTADT